MKLRTPRTYNTIADADILMLFVPFCFVPLWRCVAWCHPPVYRREAADRSYRERLRAVDPATHPHPPKPLGLLPDFNSLHRHNEVAMARARANLRRMVTVPQVGSAHENEVLGFKRLETDRRTSPGVAGRQGASGAMSGHEVTPITTESVGSTLKFSKREEGKAPPVRFPLELLRTPRECQRCDDSLPCN